MLEFEFPVITQGHSKSVSQRLQWSYAVINKMYKNLYPQQKQVFWTPGKKKKYVKDVSLVLFLSCVCIYIYI